MLLRPNCNRLEPGATPRINEWQYLIAERQQLRESSAGFVVQNAQKYSFVEEPDATARGGAPTACWVRTTESYASHTTQKNVEANSDRREIFGVEYTQKCQ